MIDRNQWHDYKLTIATKGNITRSIIYSAWNDDDAIDRASVKRLKLEDNHGEIVAYDIKACRTGITIQEQVYMNILDLL